MDAIAPPLRPSFDALTPTWDFTGATFDQQSTSLLQTSLGLVPGTAVATIAAPGAILTSVVSFITGSFATAPGATIPSVVSLVPGRAKGQGWAKPPGGHGPPWINVPRPHDGWTVVSPPGGSWDRTA